MTEGIKRRSNPYLEGSITGNIDLSVEQSQLIRLRAAARAMFGESNKIDDIFEGLLEDLQTLQTGQCEGFYNPETMMWNDGTGSHTQRCNANKLLNGGSSSRLPDGGNGY